MAANQRYEKTGRTPQPSVISDGKEHALFLWIYLHPNADPLAVVRIMARLQDHVDMVCDQSYAPGKDKMLAGVGFGKEFYSRVTRQAPLMVYIHFVIIL